MNKQVLKDLIEDLKNNPNPCTTIGGMTSLDGKFEIGESNPGEKLNAFLKEFYDNNLQDRNYIENQKQLEGKSIKDMTLEELYTMITYVVRTDRFVSGFLYQNCQNGTMLQVAERLDELESE